MINDLESQYTNQIEILINQINKAFIAELKKTMSDEGVDEAIIRQVKLNAFKDIYEKFKKLSDKFRSEYYSNKVIKQMEIIFENADKRVKKMIAKTFKDSKREIPILKLKTPSEALKNSVSENIDLIKTIVDKQVTDLQAAVFKSLRRGFDPEIIETEVLKQCDNGLEYAKFVSRDQLAKAHAAINEERQRSAGIDGYIWIVTNDSKARKSHREHHNKFYTWDKPPLINFALDNQKRAPENLHPGEDYQCRCIGLPAFSHEDALSERIKTRTY